MPRISWNDSEGPDDYDWSRDQMQIFKDATGWDGDLERSPMGEEDDPFAAPDWAQAAAFFDQGFIHMDENAQFARDWFFDWMDEHGWNIDDFDWDAWREQYEEAAG